MVVDIIIIDAVACEARRVATDSRVVTGLPRAAEVVSEGHPDVGELSG